ncbi:ADP-dependent glucokinase/phosphofructokinase [Agromyces atrinae]|uniref:ADP-dependent glucokinase/phosphofructokinase n=1 Tax=Agromyces atrinae TaxID=592376 RepID=UPI001F58ACBF|nr:ADP-dependent glucokinase/phosphofructokinase [Agromyces atrinae]MCI2956260.1 ADP-dependent glucokinase/phosphofructokinase [Agromyces atrinae]
MADMIVLGLGGTVDYEVEWDDVVVGDLARSYAITAEELEPGLPIVDERGLLVSLLAFVRDGAGGERFIASSDIARSFASRFDVRVTLGGTCVRGAIAMQSVGVESVVHLVSIDDDVRRLLPPRVRWVCSADADTTDPHLIVQFPQGAHIELGDAVLTAPHPNRVIFANDPPNRDLRLSGELPRLLADAGIFLVSGFNTIQDEAVLGERLAEIERLVAGLPAGAVSIYEDAGFHVPALSAVARDAMAPVVDLYSLNEDELASYLGGVIDLGDAASVARALGQARELIPARTLMVHTKLWSVLLGERAMEWEHALRGGIVMASTRYLHGDGHDASDYERTAALPTNPDGVRVADALPELVDEPLVCLPGLALATTRPTTIGLGDTFIGGFIAALAREESHV